MKHRTRYINFVNYVTFPYIDAFKTKKLNKFIFYKRCSRKQMARTKLTVKSNRAFRFPEGVFRDASVVTEVADLKVAYRQLHMRSVILV